MIIFIRLGLVNEKAEAIIMPEDIMDKSMVVYALTNRINGKKYVGQTARPLKQRINEHRNEHKTAIDRAIDEVGFENFTVEILEQCNTREELFQREEGSISKKGTAGSR